MSTTIEDLIAERKNWRQSITASRFDLKSALFGSNLRRAQTEQKNILKAELRIRQITFEIAMQRYIEEIMQLEQTINENS